MKTSVLIPSRNEEFLAATVRDVLAKARGELEVWVVLDGYWDHALPQDARLRLLHRGTAQGMRPAINDAARLATGDFLLKCDAHVLFAEGFDVQLAADHADDALVQVPRRWPLDPERWCIDETPRTDRKYPIDSHYLSYPFERPDDPTCGLHGTPWTARRDALLGYETFEDLSSQGSCWFMRRTHWERRVAPLDSGRYGNFVHEFQEVGLRTQMLGGAVVTNKRTSYAHLFKGKRGRGYILGPDGHRRGGQHCTWWWMHDRQPDAVRTMRGLVEQFWPVPGWPTSRTGALDWDAVARATASWTAQYERERAA